jgi:hypothetical protein
VLEKYKWEGEGETCPYLDPDISLLLQSIVMAVQGMYPDGEVQVGRGRPVPTWILISVSCSSPLLWLFKVRILLVVK